MNIKKEIESHKKLATALSMATLMRRGYRNKNVANFYIFEKEIDKFPQDLNAYANKLLRLQGYDPDFFIQDKRAEIIPEIHNIKGDKMLLVVSIFD